jgi:hypothetical protein
VISLWISETVSLHMSLVSSAAMIEWRANTQHDQTPLICGNICAYRGLCSVIGHCVEGWPDPDILRQCSVPICEVQNVLPQNGGIWSSNYAASYPRRMEFSTTPLWKCQSLQTTKFMYSCGCFLSTEHQSAFKMQHEI